MYKLTVDATMDVETLDGEVVEVYSPLTTLLFETLQDAFNAAEVARRVGNEELISWLRFREGMWLAETDHYSFTVEDLNVRSTVS